MLPADRRIRRSDEFVRVVRSGRRVGSRMLVIHLLDASSADAPLGPARVGFVVGRGVGGSVVRSQVSRRLRHLMRSRLDSIPEGALLVIRALTPAASASSAVMAVELDRALIRLIAPDATSAAFLGGRR